MNSNIIGKILYFWAFMAGVIIFGKIFGLMDDNRTTIMILIASAIIYIVWVVGRSKAAKRREEKEWQQKQAKVQKGNKRR